MFNDIMSILFNFKKYIDKKNIDKEKLMKNQFIIYVVIFIPFVLITYFFSYHLSVYSVLFFFVTTFIYGFLSLKRIKDNYDDFSYNFFFAPPLINLASIFY